MSDPSPLILAFGDSLIAGYGLRPDEILPALLQARLRATRPLTQVVNAGMSGDTTEGALRRLPRVLNGLAERPDLALLQIGPNDVLRAIPPERMRANLEAILTEFDRCAIPVLLATVAAPPFLMQRTEAYAGIHEAVAARHGTARRPARSFRRACWVTPTWCCGTGCTPMRARSRWWRSSLRQRSSGRWSRRRGSAFPSASVRGTGWRPPSRRDRRAMPATGWSAA